MNANFLSLHEPGRLEVFVNLLAGKISGRTYAEYVEAGSICASPSG